jgi:hypothetical protein
MTILEQRIITMQVIKKRAFGAEPSMQTLTDSILSHLTLSSPMDTVHINCLTL